MDIRGNQVLRVLGIVLAVVAVIGLVRFMTHTTNGANFGVFLCPGILAAVFLWVSRPQTKER